VLLLPTRAGQQHRQLERLSRWGNWAGIPMIREVNGVMLKGDMKTSGLVFWWLLLIIFLPVILLLIIIL